MSKRKLLLADDSITIQKVVNLTFAEEGIDVVTVGDGDSALARIGEEWPDLVMADVNMPGASGYQICEAIRSDTATRDIPVILLVGSFEPFDEAEAERVGANAFLTKPFHSIRQLVSQVSELIEARTQQVPEEPAVNGLAAETGPNETADDIESLYQQSVSDEPTGGTEELAFGDESLDDEMIETSYADPEAETLEFNVVDQPAAAAADAGTSADGPVEVDTPYAESAPPAEQTASAEQPTYVENVSREQESAPVEHVPVSAEPFRPIVEDAPQASDQAEDISEDTHRLMEMTTEQFQTDPTRFPEIKQSEHVEPITETADTEAESIFDDMELLDLPPVGEGTEIKFATAGEVETAGSRDRVVSISPELMEIIVEKVVEKLSNRS